MVMILYLPGCSWGVFNAWSVWKNVMHCHIKFNCLCVWFLFQNTSSHPCSDFSCLSSELGLERILCFVVKALFSFSQCIRQVLLNIYPLLIISIVCVLVLKFSSMSQIPGEKEKREKRREKLEKTHLPVCVCV